MAAASCKLVDSILNGELRITPDVPFVIPHDPPLGAHPLLYNSKSDKNRSNESNGRKRSNRQHEVFGLRIC